MEPAYVSAVAALAGSAIGGLTSLAASWITQRVQVGAQQLAHVLRTRDDLYKDFIEQASQSFVDAVEHSEIDEGKMVRLYALVSRMRVSSSQAVVAQADKVMRLLIETYRAPNRTLGEAADSVRAGELDPLLAFSEACRDESTKRALVAR